MVLPDWQAAKANKISVVKYEQTLKAVGLVDLGDVKHFAGIVSTDCLQ